MINLPRPSFLASSPDIEVLPRPQLQQLPTSAPTPFYQFGLATLPHDTDAGSSSQTSEILRELLTLSQQLSVPTLFGHGDGEAWTHSEEHYPALLQWKQQTVPALLLRVTEALKQLNSSLLLSNDAEQTPSAALDLVLGHVVCSVARYLSPTLDALSSSEVPTDDGWVNDETRSQASSVLGDLSEPASASALPNASTVAKALLVDYVKPVFREITSSSSSSTNTVDPETGRKRPPAAGSSFIPHLDAQLGQHRFQSAADDNDASNLAPRRFALSLPAESTGFVTASLLERNEALGCVNVLSWCLNNLQLGTESDWSSIWPLIVPPLLTLLEHQQPRFRLRGTLLVHHLLLRPSTPPTSSHKEDQNEQHSIHRSEIVLGRLLIRTGIGSLLERALHVNLTFIHDEQYAPALLSHSIGALRQLILLTTHPIVYLPSSSPSTDTPSEVGLGGMKLDEPSDCGKRRMEALFRLVSESILSTWSYLSLPPSSTRLGRELVSVTCTAYLRLADDLAAPAPNGETSLGGMARFLDVTLDWVFRSWMSNVAFDHTAQIPVTIKVLDVASRLLFPSTSSTETEDQHDLTPSSRNRFTGLILLSVAKCWVCALDSPLRPSSTQADSKRDERWKELDRRLAEFMANMARIDSSVQPRWAELVKLDTRLAMLLDDV